MLDRSSTRVVCVLSGHCVYSIRTLSFGLAFGVSEGVSPCVCETARVGGLSPFGRGVEVYFLVVQ